MTDKIYKSSRNPEIMFYATRPGESIEAYHARIDAYEAEQIASLVKDPTRKNCQTHDDGSRRIRQRLQDESYESEEQLPKERIQVNGKHYDKYLFPKIALSALAGITAVVLGVKCLKSLDKVEEVTIKKERSRYEQFDPALKETYKQWEQEARDRGN